MKREIVKLENVFVRFDKKVVLQNINFSVEENDFLAIIGPNGGGKTTLLKLILGLVKPDKGKVEVFGDSPEKVRDLIGYVPQYTFFDRDFPISVFDVVLMGRYRGVIKKYTDEDKNAVIEALKTMEILQLKDRQIGKLSGGQLQRVLVARAIVRNPKLLLLDEPTSNIDFEMQKLFYELLSKLKEKMAIILVTHDIGAISVYVEKIACLNQRLFYHGVVDKGLKELKESYQYPIELITHKFPENNGNIKI